MKTLLILVMILLLVMTPSVLSLSCNNFTINNKCDRGDLSHVFFYL